MGRLSDIVEPKLRRAFTSRRGAKKRGDVPEGAPIGAASSRWIISVSASGWQIADPDGATVRTGRADLPLQHRDQSELLKNLEAAFASFSAEEKRSAPSLDLLVSDPQIEVLDNRLIKGGMGDRESAARLAREVLGRDESAFDVCDFGHALHGDNERKVIAAVPLDRVRDYLLAAGDLATAIRSVTPVAAGLTSEDGQKSGVSGLLELGARQCQIILADPETGAIVQRVIPAGIADIANRLAEAQSLSPDDALAMLGERDLFSRLPAGPGETAERLSRSEDAVLSVGAGLLRDLTQTINDFSENRLADVPERLLLTGAHAEVLGLGGWLGRGLGIELGEAEGALSCPHDHLNLLRGTSDALIVHGKTRYRFQGDRFVPMQDDGSTARAKAGAAAKTAKQGRNGKGGKRGKAKDGPDNAGRNRRAMILAGIVAGGFVCLMAWDYLMAPAQARSQRNAGALAATVDRSLALRLRLDELIENHARTLRVRAQAGNKILWTEKFLSISEAIPAGLWLTDTAIIQDERSVGETDVITTKMRIRGNTILNERTNLPDIAVFIQNLEADDRFMSDFRQVTFEGMAPAGDGTLRFELHAWYDQNKRKNAAAAEAEQENAGPIDQLKQKTDARARTQDELLGLSPRGTEQGR